MSKLRRASILCAAAALAILVHLLAWFWPMVPTPKPRPEPIGGGITVADSGSKEPEQVIEKPEDEGVVEAPAGGRATPETAIAPTEKPESERGDIHVESNAPSGVLLTIDWPDRDSVEQACAQLHLRVLGFRKVDGRLSYAGEIKFDGGPHLAKLDSDLEGFSNIVRRLPRGLFEPLLSNERLDGALLLLPIEVESRFRAIVDRALADAGIGKQGPACAYGRVLSKPGVEAQLVVLRVETAVATKRG